MDIIQLLELHNIPFHGVDKGKGEATKLDIKPYVLETTQVNQKEWSLPQDSYDDAIDSLIVFYNTVYLSPESYTITGDAGSGYKLGIPDAPDTEITDNNVSVVVFKNTPDVNTQFSGTLLTDGSIALAKLGQDVQDAINKTGSKEAEQAEYIIINPKLPTDTDYKDGFTFFQPFNKKDGDTEDFHQIWFDYLVSEFPQIAEKIIVSTTSIRVISFMKIYASRGSSPYSKSGYQEIYITNIDGLAYKFERTFLSPTIPWTIRMTFDHARSYEVDLDRHSNTVATPTTLGHVKPDGTTIQITEDGVISTGNYSGLTVSTGENVIYARQDGSDASGDGSISNPFKTIQHAVDTLPDIINHNIFIRMSGATYQEYITIPPKLGAGEISFHGVTGTILEGYLDFQGATCNINVSGMTIKPNIKAIGFKNCPNTNVNNIKFDFTNVTTTRIHHGISLSYGSNSLVEDVHVIGNSDYAHIINADRLCNATVLKATGNIITAFRAVRGAVIYLGDITELTVTNLKSESNYGRVVQI